MTKQTNPPDANPQYLPVGLFSKYPPLSEWRARWYAGELRDLEEPSLRRGKITSGTVYRFLLIPPFTPSLVEISLQRWEQDAVGAVKPRQRNKLYL
jgi:hypothetical protein